MRGKVHKLVIDAVIYGTHYGKVEDEVWRVHTDIADADHVFDTVRDPLVGFTDHIVWTILDVGRAKL